MVGGAEGEHSCEFLVDYAGDVDVLWIDEDVLTVKAEFFSNIWPVSRQSLVQIDARATADSRHLIFISTAQRFSVFFFTAFPFLRIFKSFTTISRLYSLVCMIMDFSAVVVLATLKVCGNPLIIGTWVNKAS